ncbi:hypothetical protein DSUL_30070 [Desulfovibrionales bacterium]
MTRPAQSKQILVVLQAYSKEINAIIYITHFETSYHMAKQMARLKIDLKQLTHI